MSLVGFEPCTLGKENVCEDFIRLNMTLRKHVEKTKL